MTDFKDLKKDSFEDLIPSIESKGMNLGLQRIKEILVRAGSPCINIPAIQIAGTNGKGSIAYLIESCLNQAGIQTGCTISPHLVSWRERIRVNGEIISRQDFKSCIQKILSIDKSKALTPFELLIAAAFTHFSSKKVQLIILEVGLGGRLDATTAHPLRPIIAMGPIGLDHCNILGNSLKAITREKGAVISQGSSVVSAKQNPIVENELKKIVKEKNANLIWVKPLSQNWELGLSGEVQRENAAVAKAALELLIKFDFKVSRKAIKDGLSLAEWPGRLQTKVWNGYPLILDGAHNPHAINRLAKERLKWSEKVQSINWIIGIQAQKDAPTMMRALLHKKDIAWIVPIPFHLCWDKKALSKACPELANQFRQKNSIEKVLQAFQAESKWPSPPPVITGSLHLLGDFLKTC